MKKHLSVKLTKKDLEFIERLASTTGIRKANMLEFTLSIINTYFTEDQLRAEAELFEPADGRKNGD